MSDAAVSREELLRRWKEKRTAAGGAGEDRRATLGPGQPNNSQRQPAPAGAAEPAPGLPPRLARASSVDKENVGAGAGAGGRAPAAATAAAPDTIRKAFANGQQQQEMLQEFDALQGRLQALKRESVRPSISDAAAASRPGALQSAATSRPQPPEPAGARATQPAAAVTTTARPPLAAAPPRQHAASAPTQQPAPLAPAAEALPAGVSASRGGAEPEGASMLAPASAPGAGVGGLAARLESLKRESVRPSMLGSQAGVQFEAQGAIDSQALSRLAIQLFDDKEFRSLCDRGMSAQLTRSKDGATGAEWVGCRGRRHACSEVPASLPALTLPSSLATAFPSPLPAE